MPLLVLLSFLALAGTALVYSVAALRRAANREAFWGILLRGPFAGRRFFTLAGWRFRNRALMFQALAFAVILGWFLGDLILNA